MEKRVFIVRPFGTQEGIDFDAVERTLIQPAIGRAKTATLAGGTTRLCEGTSPGDRCWIDSTALC
jgi:hypothetical protein